MDALDIKRQFQPALDEIVELCSITDSFVDMEMFQVYIATVWGNAVLEPARSGMFESDLPVLHDFLNEEVARVLGDDACITGCYEFIISKPGADALERLRVTKRHKEFLYYFARLILNKLPSDQT